MSKLNKRDMCTLIIVVLLILLAWICRFANNLKIEHIYKLSIALIRSFIYIGLIFSWGISIRKRIMQKEVCNYLTAVAALLIFWFVIRTMKYLVLSEVDTMMRCCWYLFYIPIIFVPMYGILAATCMGKPEGYAIPRWRKLFYLPALILLLLVLTNDLHQLAFRFPGGVPNNGYIYSRGFLYFVVAAWIVAETFGMMVILFKKSRLPGKRKRIWPPTMFSLVAIAYGVLYILEIPVVKAVAGDMTVVFCLMMMGVFEACIQAGLIQSNSRYEELFHASTIAAQITDENYIVRYSAGNTLTPELRLLKGAENKPVMLDGGIRLSHAAIGGGHMFWREDVSELLAVLEKLGDTQDELRSYGSLLDEENKQKQRRRELEEQKRLYDAVQRKVAPTMTRLNGLIGQLDATDKAAAKAQHKKIAIVGAYLKRRSNLVFLADQTGMVPARELLLCLNESVSNLRLAGTTCAVQFDLNESINGEAAGLLYDFFEAVVETAWDQLPALNIVVTQYETDCRILLMLPIKMDLSAIAARFANGVFEQDEEVCYCSLTVPKGGASA